MLTSVYLFLKLHFRRKEDVAMLVRLYAGEVILGKITTEDVPARLRKQVILYLEEMGYSEE